MLHLIKEVRDIGRFNEIISVLVEEGFEFLVAKINLGQDVRMGGKKRKKKKKKYEKKNKNHL